MLRLCLMLAVVGMALVQGQRYPDPLPNPSCTDYCSLGVGNYYCCDEQRPGDGGRFGSCPKTPITPEELEYLASTGNHNSLNCQSDNECDTLEKCCYAKEPQAYRICRLIEF